LRPSSLSYTFTVVTVPSVVLRFGVVALSPTDTSEQGPVVRLSADADEYLQKSEILSKFVGLEDFAAIRKNHRICGASEICLFQAQGIRSI